MRIRFNTTTDVALFLDVCSKYPGKVVLYSCISGKPVEVNEDCDLLASRIPKSYDAYIYADSTDAITQFRRDIALWEDWT